MKKPHGKRDKLELMKLELAEAYLIEKTRAWSGDLVVKSPIEQMLLMALLPEYSPMVKN